MEKILCPEKLDADPNSVNAEKEYKYWKKTFDNFMEECGENAPNKLRCLTKFVSASVYEYFADSPTYEAALSTLDKLYIKQKNEIFARHLLATRRQQSSESLDEYLQILQKLSKDCKFKPVTSEQYREELVRDAFINGIMSPSIRQRLLENQSLTLIQAYDQARALDSAYRNSESYNPNGTVVAALPYDSEALINSKSLSKDSQNSSEGNSTLTAASVYQNRKRCWFCGGGFHSRFQCPAKDSECSACNKIGHWSKVCQSKLKKKVTAVAGASALCSVTSAAIPSCLKSSSVAIDINGKPVTALLDSCSSDSFINEEVAKQLKLQIQPACQNITLASSSSQTSVVGTCKVILRLNETNYHDTKLGVIKDLCGDVILGIDFQEQHESLIIKYGGAKPSLLIGNQHIPICNLAIADVNVPSLFLNMRKDVKPIATQSRNFSHMNKNFIEQEIRNLLSEGIIEPSTSSWRAQVVIACDELNRHRKRLCVDYSSTINICTEADAYPLPKIETMINTLANYKFYSTFDLKCAYYQIPIQTEDRPYTAFEANGRLFQFTRLPFGVTNGVAIFQRIIDDIVDKEGLQDTFPYLDNITVCGKTKEKHDENVRNLLAVAKRRNLTLNESKSVLSVKSINVLGYNVEYGQIKPDSERLKPLQEMPPPNSKPALQRILGMFAYYAKWIPKFSDEAQALFGNKSFPLNNEAVVAFNRLKELLGKAALGSIDESIPFVVECDASDVAISATLNQNQRPVAFMSRTLNNSEKHYPPVEKEATAIIEAIRKWPHLSGRHFTIVTDQRSVAFMLDNRKRSKIKNDKIQCWRLELASFSYSIIYRPGKENVAADALSRAYCSSVQSSTLKELHEGLCHPGITRMLHFVRSKNLPFSTENVKSVCSSCRICAEIKPKFYSPKNNSLIKALHPMDRMSIDFKGPLQSRTKNIYLFTAVDEFSRFPFAIPCSDMSSQTVIKCLDTIFSLCGMPNYIHSDRGSAFLSREVVTHLTGRGVACSKSTPYHPTGNSQVERYNGIIWKAIQLALKTSNLHESEWEIMLPQALHSVRSLLSTSTNETPHERFFKFQRRSGQGSSLPTWLTQPGPVFLRRFVRKNKSDPLVDEVELIQATPTYAHIRYPDGRESSVALKDLAPCPSDRCGLPDASQDIVSPLTNHEIESDGEVDQEISSHQIPLSVNDNNHPNETSENVLRSSTRVRREPDRYGW